MWMSQPKFTGGTSYYYAVYDTVFFPTASNPDTVREILAEQRAATILFYPVIFDHSCIFPGIIAFNPKDRSGSLCVDHVVIIAMRAVFVALLIHFHVLAERLFALLTYESHFHGSFERMGRSFSMTLGTIEPHLAARCPNGNLGIQNMLAH